MDEDLKLYSLIDVLGGSKAYSDYETRVEFNLDSPRKNENISLRCVQEWLKGFCDEVEIIVDRLAAHLAILPKLLFADRQSPDLLVLKNDKIVLVVEILSGHDYLECLKVCAIHGMDLVRYYNNFGKDVALSVLLLPNTNISFATEISVKFDFDHLVFSICCKPITDAVVVHKCFLNVIHQNELSIGEVDEVDIRRIGSRNIYPIPILFSYRLFKEADDDNITQIATGQLSIIVSNNQYVYKYISDCTRRGAVTNMMLTYPNEDDSLILLPTAVSKIGRLLFLI